MRRTRLQAILLQKPVRAMTMMMAATWLAWLRWKVRQFCEEPLGPLGRCSLPFKQMRFSPARMLGKTLDAIPRENHILPMKIGVDRILRSPILQSQE
jgi:hypothetical protein